MAALIGIALWALVPGFIAKKKGRSFWGYYFLSFLISPLITTIITLCLSKVTDEEKIELPEDPNRITECKSCGYRDKNFFNACPKCGNYAKQYVYLNEEPVDHTDKVCFCRKCGEKLIDNSQFCRKCGAEVVKEPTITIPDPDNSYEEQKGIE